MSNLSFQYEGPIRNLYEDVNLVIPESKITAIVGVSVPVRPRW